MPRVSQRTIQKAWIVGGILYIFFATLTLFQLYEPLFNQVAQAERNLTNPEISAEEKAQQATSSVLDFGILRLFGIEFKIGDIPIFDILDMTVLTIIILLFFPAYYYRKDLSWREKIDNNLPNLLREISDAQKVGLPLPRAVIEASKRQYGPLTDELKLMASKISWGIPFSQGLREMQQNISTPLFDRTSVLILEAEKAGGQTDEIFDSAYVHVSELLGLKRERLASMSPYKWIIIVAFIVFALVIVILLNSFFAQLAVQNAQIAASGDPSLESGLGGLNLHVALLQLLFFHLLLIEGFFAGLIASKMSTGHYTQGLTSSMMLLVMAWFIFKLGMIFA
jgi:flagellar protein FlaJ